jgi:hypothetical protein
MHPYRRGQRTTGRGASTSVGLMAAAAFPTRCAQLRQIDTSRPWTATAQITNTSTEMMSSAQNG